MRKLFHRFLDFLQDKMKIVKLMFYISLVLLISSLILSFLRGDNLGIKDSVGYNFIDFQDTIVSASSGIVKTFDHNGNLLKKWTYDEATGSSMVWKEGFFLVVDPARGPAVLYFNSAGQKLKSVSHSEINRSESYQLERESRSNRFMTTNMFYKRIYDSQEGIYITSLSTVEYFIFTPWYLFVGLFGGLMFLGIKVKRFKDERVENRKNLFRKNVESSKSFSKKE